MTTPLHTVETMQQDDTNSDNKRGVMGILADDSGMSTIEYAM